MNIDTNFNGIDVETDYTNVMSIKLSRNVKNEIQVELCVDCCKLKKWNLILVRDNNGHKKTKIIQ